MRCGKKRSLILLTVLLVVLLLLPFPLLRLLYPIHYEQYIDQYAEVYEVPRAVICAVIHTESHFRKNAVSSAGARGLMQLMPQTYASLAKALGRESDEALIFDPETNIECGVYLLHQLYRKYGCWETVFAAYNAGEPTVDRWLADPTLAEGAKLTSIPYSETAAYVKKVDRAVKIYQFLYN